MVTSPGFSPCTEILDNYLPPNDSVSVQNASNSLVAGLLGLCPPAEDGYTVIVLYGLRILTTYIV